MQVAQAALTFFDIGLNHVTRITFAGMAHITLIKFRGDKTAPSPFVNLNPKELSKLCRQRGPDHGSAKRGRLCYPKAYKEYIP